MTPVESSCRRSGCPSSRVLEVVPFKPAVLHGFAAVTALETVTANAFCMTRSADRQYHRQCRERHECQFFSSCCCLTFFPGCGMATASGRFTLQRSVTRCAGPSLSRPSPASRCASRALESENVRRIWDDQLTGDWTACASAANAWSRHAFWRREPEPRSLAPEGSPRTLPIVPPRFTLGSSLADRLTTDRVRQWSRAVESGRPWPGRRGHDAFHPELRRLWHLTFRTPAITRAPSYSCRMDAARRRCRLPPSQGSRSFLRAGTAFSITGAPVSANDRESSSVLQSRFRRQESPSVQRAVTYSA